MRLVFTIVFRLLIVLLLVIGGFIALVFHQPKIFLTLLIGGAGVTIFLLFDLFIFSSVKNKWFDEPIPERFAKDFYNHAHSLNGILIATSGVIIGILGSIPSSKLLPFVTFGIVILAGVINANLLIGALLNQYTEESVQTNPITNIENSKFSYEYVELHPLHVRIFTILLNLQFAAFIVGTISVIVLSIP
jgi:hypothetical protein